jgi:hypothetical protein
MVVAPAHRYTWSIGGRHLTRRLERRHRRLQTFEVAA